jgi:ParB family chromosome partitioning protein
MDQQSSKPKLDQIPVRLIRPNPENPRLAFRQGELDELQESIRVYGVQVPIAVYKDGGNFFLIDGERRWRCSVKLNKKTIPALIQEKPSPLQNLLLMFNIHSLREQWDLLTIALKLPKVIALLKKERKKQITEAELSGATGLSRASIRRCKLIMDLPKKYKDMLLDELKKPKAKQRLSEDFFIEMERALKTVSRAMPSVITNRDAVRDTLLDKYERGIIDNIVDFRKVAKIARAEKVGADPSTARRAIERLMSDANYSINEAFDETVSGVYAERDIVSRIEALIIRLDNVPQDAIDEDVREKLEELIERARRLLKEAR